MDINLNQKPIEDYIQLSNYTSIHLPLPFIKKQLLILDLNGTLICRPKGAAGSFYLRHHHTAFFDYIFSNFTVMVWSSAQEKSVKSMVKALPNTLRLIWNRSHFDLEPAAFNSAAETIKDLDKVWEALPEFNASNTIVLDDTAVKLIKQPFNLVKVRTFEHNAECDHELYHVIDYLKMLQMETNVANFIKENPYVSKNNLPEEDCGEMLRFTKHGRNLSRKKSKSLACKLNDKSHELTNTSMIYIEQTMQGSMDTKMDEGSLSDDEIMINEKSKPLNENKLKRKISSSSQLNDNMRKIKKTKNKKKTKKQKQQLEKSIKEMVEKKTKDELPPIRPHVLKALKSIHTNVKKRKEIEQSINKFKQA